MHVLLKLMHFSPSQQAARSAPLLKATVCDPSNLFQAHPIFPSPGHLNLVWAVCLLLSFQFAVMPGLFQSFPFDSQEPFLLSAKRISFDIQKFWLSELLLQLIALKIYLRSKNPNMYCFPCYKKCYFSRANVEVSDPLGEGSSYRKVQKIIVKIYWAAWMNQTFRRLWCNLCGVSCLERQLQGV